MTRKPAFIPRVRVWRRLIVMAVFAAGLSFFLPSLIHNMRSTSAPMLRVDVHVHVKEGRVDGAELFTSPDREPGAPGRTPIVEYVGTRSSDQESFLRRRDITFWSSQRVVMPDGRRLAPDHDEVTFMRAADATFEKSLPPGSAIFLWKRGVKTWRVAQTERDVSQGVATSLTVIWRVVIAATVALWTLIIWAEVRARRRHAQDTCWHCGYDKSNIQDGICPECGSYEPRAQAQEP